MVTEEWRPDDYPTEPVWDGGSLDAAARTVCVLRRCSYAAALREATALCEGMGIRTHGWRSYPIGTLAVALIHHAVARKLSAGG